MKISNTIVPKVFVVILCASLFVGLITSLGVSYCVGAASQEEVPKDAVHIKTAEQLAAIGGEDSEGKYYVLDNDLDLVDEWAPIDDFRGTFDGQGHTINNLYVLESSNRKYAGLFGEITYAITINNVAVNININGLAATSAVGGLIGFSRTVDVVDSYVTGNIIVSGSSVTVGGLIGLSGDTVINNSYTTGDIVAEASQGRACAGGLIGLSSTIVVANSYASGDVTALSSSQTYQPACAGGLIGYNMFDVIVENSFATGKIIATDVSSISAGYFVCAGGLIGYSGYGDVTVMNSYATGSILVTASGHNTCAGGLIGYIWVGNVVAENSYTISDIITSGKHTYAGDLVGYNDGGVDAISCYSLSTQKIIGDTTNEAGVSLSPEEMKNKESFVGWDFDTIWTIDPDINEGYPSFITNNKCDLLGSFWFIALLVGVIVLVIVGVVYVLLKKSRSHN
ncbi:MAG: hypothetical protein FWH37_06545 [Candidatus Bathyarchaeota archaeon]|nr:hypothetical protein [Candidatus Termiticorpusculum sp.]